MMRVASMASRALLIAALAACASTGGGSRAEPQPKGPAWPVLTREHVDLWLHGYAMLTRDEARVPVFRRGYRDQMTALRKQRNVLTALDANHDKLASLMARNPEIANGQFVPMYFSSFAQMQQVVNAFLQADGDPRRVAGDAQVMFAVLANSFPTAQDREWLRLFMLSLNDESQQFYRQYWTEQQGQHRPAVVAADSTWQAARPRFQTFLNRTQQASGDLILSLVLGGEGRTVNFSNKSNVIVSTVPDSPSQAAAPIYVLAHEAVQVITNPAIADNTTPAEQRSGVADSYTPIAAVQGGAMLLRRIAPYLVDGYMRYYLAQVGVASSGADVLATFDKAFALPPVIATAIGRQLDTVLGGI
jgi:hypothetical protein